MTDPTSLPSFPPPADEHPLRGIVLDALQDEGFRPDIDADGDVSFKIEGQQLFVHCTEGELPVMRIFGQWQIADNLPDDLLTQMRAANDRLYPVVRAIYGPTPVIDMHTRMKDGLEMMGVIKNAAPRLPLLPQSDEVREGVRKALIAAEVL